MGPLVPDIISPDLNLVAALLIGIAFGWILEQAGFSSSRRLVGLFYGYDFTVLRVFFTAGVTAMSGLIALEHFGMIDIGLIYINPMFLWSALAGGLIMGLGFVIGGYCPGTSVCAAAIGKTDAMLFVAGALLGVLVFAEGYPLFETLYKAGDADSPQIFDTLGMPKAPFAFLLTAMALIAFWAVSLIEARSHGMKPAFINLNRVTATVAAAGILVAVSGFVMPARKDVLTSMANRPDVFESHPVQLMTPDELAFRLLDRDERLRIVDFRSEEDFTRFRLPSSVSFTIDNLFEKEPSRLLSVRRMTNLFLAESEEEARRAAIIAEKLGFTNIRVLEGGMDGFRKTILAFKAPVPPHSRENADACRFRAHAASVLPGMIAADRSSGVVKKTVKRTVGGC